MIAVRANSRFRMSNWISHLQQKKTKKKQTPKNKTTTTKTTNPRGQLSTRVRPQIRKWLPRLDTIYVHLGSIKDFPAFSLVLCPGHLWFCQDWRSHSTPHRCIVRSEESSSLHTKQKEIRGGLFITRTTHGCLNYNPFPAKPFTLLVLFSSKSSLKEMVKRPQLFILRTQLRFRMYQNWNLSREFAFNIP